MKTQLFLNIFILISIFSFSQNPTFQEKIITPGTELSSAFGVSVDVQGDVLVGSDTSDPNGSVAGTGAAFVYRKDGNGNFSFEQKLKAPLLDAGDSYGIDVEINGNFIAVGAFRYKFSETANGFPTVNRAGAVFLYKYNTNTNAWDLVNQIYAPTRVLNHEFGWRIILTDTQLFVSERFTSNAGKVHVYDYDSNGNVTYNQGIDNPEPNSSDLFGWEISLSGNTLAIGANGEEFDQNGNNELNNAGAVYVFERNGSGLFNLQQKIVPNTRVTSANFGGGLDLNNNNLVVGAINETRIQPGTTNTLSCGIAYVFKYNGATWSQTALIEPPTVENNADFGSSINLDNNTVLISYEGGRVPFNGSSRTSGLVEQITLDNSGQVSNRFTIAPPFPDSTGEFGYITSWDGNQLAVGAFADRGDINGNILNESPGAVYVYNLDANLATDTFSSTTLKINNPVKDKLTIINLKKNANYNIYDINGKSIQTGKISISNSNIDTSWIAKGFYVLNIDSDDRHQNFKIIKE